MPFKSKTKASCLCGNIPELVHNSLYSIHYPSAPAQKSPSICYRYNQTKVIDAKIASFDRQAHRESSQAFQAQKEQLKLMKMNRASVLILLQSLRTLY